MPNSKYLCRCGRRTLRAGRKRCELCDPPQHFLEVDGNPYPCTCDPAELEPAQREQLVAFVRQHLVKP